MSQKIRPSQFVTTYGPGSIIELPNGPAIIPSARIGLFKDRNPEDYEIQALVFGIRLFRDDLQTNFDKKDKGFNMSLASLSRV